MKRAIDLLFVLVLLTFAFPALAQENSNLSEIVLKKAYRDNWYVSIGPSANLLFAEQDKLVSPLKRVKFGGELSVGKWLNQNTGISLNIVGGGLRGFNLAGPRIESAYYTDKDKHLLDHPKGGQVTAANGYKLVNSKDGQAGFWQDFNYTTATIDIMGNLTNMARGYDEEKSFFNLIAFAGVGLNYAYDNKVSNPDFCFVTGRIGLRANFNVTNNIAIYLEPAAYITDPEFDGYRGTAVGDLYTTWSLGLQYTFNKTVSSFQKQTIDELDRLNRRVNENRDLIENHQDILERQQRLLDKLGNTTPSYSHTTEKPVTIVHSESSKLPEYIRFALDSYRLEKTEYSKIQNVVDFIKENPNTKILLVGYADKKTGNPTYNLNLSKKRVEAVKAELHRFGINENQLLIEWKGDKEQPFATNEWNRVVIMVERK